MHLKLMIKQNKKSLRPFNQQKILNMESSFTLPINHQDIGINQMSTQNYKWELMFQDQFLFLSKKYYGLLLIVTHLTHIVNTE